MYKNQVELETIKSVALKEGFNEEQVKIALDALEQSTLVIILKENGLFDVIETKNNEVIAIDAKISLVIEMCYDCLRNELESYLRQENIDLEYANITLNKLNSMFENSKYTIKSLNEVKYLALNI